MRVWAADAADPPPGWKPKLRLPPPPPLPSLPTLPTLGHLTSLPPLPPIVASTLRRLARASRAALSAMSRAFDSQAIALHLQTGLENEHVRAAPALDGWLLL